jgi:hypothetical protein
MTRKNTVWIAIVVAAVSAVVVTFLLLRVHRLRLLSLRQVVIEGAVMRKDPDANWQLPIAGVVITATVDGASAATQSEASGYFRLVLQRKVLSSAPVLVTFRSASYQPFDLNIQTKRLQVPNQLYIVRMDPISTKKSAPGPKAPATTISNVRVRYTINSRTATSIGSAVRTFQVVNKGNVPCQHQSPCSPDGKWKASSASVTLDAGADNYFSNVRASCIAGPCPFTRIDARGFTHGGRTITASALNWSDTATFLLEAEVYHTQITSNVRELYPVIFGSTLNFTLPPTAEGVSLEAEINGAPMVFPLGPDLNLSWATCSVETSSDQEKTMVYRCGLKPAYKF